ncbi:hypothetical protein RF11_03613 [Thelohanellus kitauei]|uniref:Uncharacterized protein n=1 Tax=Thelohanellus kitauei TaxID=669202 RepID=A0A0C2JUP7_THEKT|nr:hypothetical protein RF11_03613 [Thelohanellus kitauei]
MRCKNIQDKRDYYTQEYPECTSYGEGDKPLRPQSPMVPVPDVTVFASDYSQHQKGNVSPDTEQFRHGLGQTLWQTVSPNAFGRSCVGRSNLHPLQNGERCFRHRK